MSKGLFESVKDSAKHYWSQLGQTGGGFSDFAKQLFGNTKSNWGDALGTMGKLYGNADAGEALLDRLMGQGKSFMSLLEQAYRSKLGDKLDFSALAKSALDQLTSQNPFASAFGGLQSGLFSTPAFAEMFNAKGFDLSKLQMPQFLDFPAFGLAREHQERQIELFKHMKAHHEANQRYNELTAKSMQAGIERMQSKLAERTEAGRELDSLKAIYDLWIDSLEESFAETALSADYQDAYAALVDTQMRVRSNVQKQVELQCGQLGMPTRSEVDSVHKKLAEMRRERRQMPDLSAEIAELRAEITALKASAKPVKKAPTSAPAVSKQPIKASVRPAAKLQSRPKLALKAPAKSAPIKAKPAARPISKPISKTKAKVSASASRAVRQR